METTLRDQIIEYLAEIAPEAEGVFMAPAAAVFEENTKMNCFYCGKYGRNWRCPPNLPEVDFKKLFGEYNKGLFVCFEYATEDMPKERYEQVRSESSIKLHHTLLKLETWLYNHNCPTAISFGAGSCKLCKTGCGKERCNKPYESRSPLEATGVNVLKSAAKYGIKVEFPATKTLKRIGLIMWQDPVVAQERAK